MCSLYVRSRQPLYLMDVTVGHQWRTVIFHQWRADLNVSPIAFDSGLVLELRRRNLLKTRSRKSVQTLKVNVWNFNIYLECGGKTFHLKVHHESSVRNARSCEKKACKIFRLEWDSNPWILRHRCCALTLELRAGSWSLCDFMIYPKKIKILKWIIYSIKLSSGCK